MTKNVSKRNKTSLTIRMKKTIYANVNDEMIAFQSITVFIEQIDNKWHVYCWRFNISSSNNEWWMMWMKILSTSNEWLNDLFADNMNERNSMYEMQIQNRENCYVMNNNVIWNILNVRDFVICVRCKSLQLCCTH